MILHGDRIRTRTASAVLRRIDSDTTAHLQHLADAGPADIEHRLTDLDHEWDTDRVIELEAATTGLVGLALGTLVRSAFLAVPAFVGGSLFAYALTGWYPLLPLFRRLGIRSAREIARERYALKALRGDFVDIGASSESETATAAASGPTPQVEQPRDGGSPA
ncbi:MAG: hypothetical protein ACJ8J7_02395 [Sulfurifustaceae bacterium]